MTDTLRAALADLFAYAAIHPPTGGIGTRIDALRAALATQPADHEDDGNHYCKCGHTLPCPAALATQPAGLDAAARAVARAYLRDDHEGLMGACADLCAELGETKP